MRELFVPLKLAAEAKGMWGVFELHLSIEANVAPLTDICGALIRQNFAAYRSSLTQYDWGAVAYHELPKAIKFEPTKLYSAYFLKHAFNWDTELPAFDGIVCQVKDPGEYLIDSVQDAVALVWSNLSDKAVTKRSRDPISAFAEATSQIPSGEVGVLYVCYQEGDRGEIADARTQSYLNRIRLWNHDAGVRIPVSVLTRLYPRALGHGAPDLIENAIPMVSELYGDKQYFKDFPTNVFTRLKM